MAYHIDVTGTSGNITQIQYDRLKADADSYVILRTNDGVVRQLNFALERANVLLYSKIHGQNSMIVEVNPNLSYNFRTETIETTENKTETITADSTTTEYPTAKTAFEYINSVVGISIYLLTVDASNINQNPSNPTRITKFTPIQLKFTAKQGYYLPDDITVTNATSVWDKLTGTLTISEPTNNVSVTISGVPMTYSISTNLTNVNAVAGNATSIKTDETKVLKFTTEPGWSLPDAVTVENAIGVWDKNSGSLVLTKPTGSVTITLVGTLTVYSIIVVASHITQVSGNPTTITKGQTQVLRFNTVTGYNYPDNITVTGAVSSSWKKSTGTLTLVGGTGNISVNIAGSPQAYNITTNLTNVTANASNPKVIYRDSSVTLKFTASDGYELPINIPKATNIGSQTWDRITGTLKLFNPTADVTVTLSGVIDYVEKYTSVTLTLSQAKYNLASISVGNYALFGGGAGDSISDTVDAYDASFTKTIPTALSVARYSLAATKIGSYALFGGGYNGNATNAVDAYNTSLTKTTPTALSSARYSLSATNVGNYALFAGGSGNSDVVDAYDTSLTRTIPTALSMPKFVMAATTIGDHALFGGGRSGRTTSAVVDAYNSSLTKTIPPELSVARVELAATSVGNHALFGGGNKGDDQNVVDAYDASLTRTIPMQLSVARSSLAATTAGNHALFGGGGGVGVATHSNVVDAYDMSLTRTIPTELSTARPDLAATSINNYALFGGGGSTSQNASNGIDIYESKFIYDSVFANNSWATIAMAFKFGIARKVWSVGDTKTITSKSGKQYTIRIADMQSGRYAYADGSGSSNGVLEFAECIDLNGTNTFVINASGSDVGGFAASDIRNTSLLSILADLPDDMQAAISEVNVLSGTGSGTTSGTSSSANKLFLPAEMEMFDAKHNSIGLEECPLGQFDYYKTHNTDADRIKKTTGTTSSQVWWLRSPSSGNFGYWCNITVNGYYNYDYVSTAFGVSPIFAI